MITKTLTLKIKLAINVTGTIRDNSRFFSFTIPCHISISISTIVAATPASIPFNIAEITLLSLKALKKRDITDNISSK